MSTYNGEYASTHFTALWEEQTETSFFFEKAFTIKSKTANF